MQKIQIKNIRSLKKTGYLPLAPITLLVGENSSGKSTFLRTFPLLKQSIIKKTDGPILWAGDVDDYVDFGSFKETVTDGRDHSEMEIGFQFSTYLNPDFIWIDPFSEDSTTSSQIEFRISIKSLDEKEHVSVLTVKIDSTRFEILFDQNIVKVNGEDIVVKNSKFDQSMLQNATDNYYFWHLGRIGGTESIFGYSLKILYECVMQQIRDLPDLSMGNSTNEAILFYIGKALSSGYGLDNIEDFRDLRNYRARIPQPAITKLNSFLKKLAKLPKKKFEKFAITAKLFFFYISYAQIERYVAQYFKQVHYMAPLRATAERYYRLRNSAIDEVDYQGKNLAIFLNSLNPRRMKNFQAWTQSNFGFEVKVQKIAGHLSLAITREGFGKEINLSDTGFGYSQILPIITQLWELSTRSQKGSSQSNTPLIVAIEQPELHLHPAMQGRLAKAFIACIKLAKENGYELQLLLETHSKTMVDYFGRAIARNDLKVSDIAVILFERDEKAGHTKATATKYDSVGALKKWPIGFFEPEE